MYTFAQLFVRNATLTVDSTDAVRWRSELLRSFVDLRGHTLGKDQFPVPKTTVADVQQVAVAFTSALGRAPKKYARDKSEHKRWAICLDDISTHTRGLKPTDIYPDNENFWALCTARLSIYLSSVNVRPSKWTMVTESVKESAAELPRRVTSAASSAASAVGNVAGSAVSGLAGALVPLGIGAAVIVGGALMLRRE